MPTDPTAPPPAPHTTDAEAVLSPHATSFPSWPAWMVRFPAFVAVTVLYLAALAVAAVYGVVVAALRALGGARWGLWAVLSWTGLAAMAAAREPAHAYRVLAVGAGMAALTWIVPAWARRRWRPPPAALFMVGRRPVRGTAAMAAWTTLGAIVTGLAFAPDAFRAERVESLLADGRFMAYYREVEGERALVDPEADAALYAYLRRALDAYARHGLDAAPPPPDDPDTVRRLAFEHAALDEQFRLQPPAQADRERAARLLVFPGEWARADFRARYTPLARRVAMPWMAWLLLCAGMGGAVCRPVRSRRRPPAASTRDTPKPSDAP